MRKVLSLCLVELRGKFAYLWVDTPLAERKRSETAGITRFGAEKNEIEIKTEYYLASATPAPPR